MDWKEVGGRCGVSFHSVETITLDCQMTFRYNNLYVVYVTNFLKCHWDVTMMRFFNVLTCLYMFAIQQPTTRVHDCCSQYT